MGRPKKQHELALGQAGAGASMPAIANVDIGSSAAGAKSWKWLLVGVNICALLSGVAAAAFLWLMALPPAPECDKLSSLSPDIDRLSCAEAAVQSGELDDLLSGLALLESWTPDRPLYGEAQRLRDDWSEQLLYRARRQMSEGQLDSARRLVEQIPQSSSAYAEGQEIVAQWDNLWKKGEAIAAQIQTDLKAQNWAMASAGIRELEKIPHTYWRSQQSAHFSQRVWQERKARKLEKDVLRQARSGQPDDLAKAMTLAGEMHPDTFARQDVQPLLNQWSTVLLETGRQQWQAGKLDQAIALAQQVKLNPALAKQADHLIRLSEARKLAFATTSTWETSPQDVYRLEEAIAAAQTIPADSRFYAQAQDSLINWRQQVNDLKRLQMAQLMAHLGTVETYRAAIAQAETIGPKHTRRRQAQTLAAHWRREIERIEDGDILVRARRLAQPGTIPAWREAIAEAAQIPMGRALRGEAQALIYEWTAQIQRIEDEPLLTLARTQARQGKLRDAIRTASAIQPGRFLHRPAQASIRQWRAQIQQAETRRRRALEAQAAQAQTVQIAEPAETLPEKQPISSPEPSEAPRSFSRPARPVEPVPPPPSEAPPVQAAPVPREVVQPLYAPLQAPTREAEPPPPAPEPAAPAPVAPVPVSVAVPEPAQPE